MDSIKFSDLGLNEKVLKAIDDMGFEEPSKIQEEVIPVVLKGFDVIGQAQTGTGKTLAFGAPIISKLDNSRQGKIDTIILTPTRELAIQVNDELNRIAKYTKIKLLPVYGGQPIERQINALKRGIDIVVGTPGRVLDLIRRNVIDLADIKFLILDEADEMLDMGFIDDIEEIIRNCNKDRQTMLFSATMPDEIRKLSKKYMAEDTKYISIVKNTMTVSTVSQFYYEVKQKDRFEALCRILDVDEPSSAIIFCKTKKGVDELVEALEMRGYNAEGMHGDMSQSHRLNTLKKFKEGNLDFLVATDVAARGIDVENVSHVINYDLPQDTESYVHRIGRTGRANREGTAYTLVTSREYYILKQIEKATRSKIRRKEVPSIDEIFLTKYKGTVAKVREAIEKEEHKRFVPLATELDEEFNLVDVAAALFSMVIDKEMGSNYSEDSIGNADSYVRLFLSVGRMDKINPRSLLQFFSDNANTDKEDIGDIDIMEKFTFVNATSQAAKDIIKYCSGKRLMGRRVNIEISRPR
ncbi:DEAD/DEAH box helicase [Lutispora thermophila]|uniref:ATP-dependent RNA helicase CshA n=1 Tax=Lutispora thermophila DSM 19022 TaxID=1122184 RepID=A0A1M6IYA5_9FIRM|nr:DEAD/DEAH box helicase [Lutispora thermophila]SHJ39406.1 ATP-dependent RNA helicase DeaD [Lutispora thermophila DSM 19022]